MMAVPSIAVLPFAVIGEVADKTHAGMALADDVATELLQMPRWYSSRITSVPGQGTSGSKAADREARARYQVFGNVHQLGDVTHVNVQLIEAERSRPLWGQSFTYPQFDNSGERTRLVAQIARAVVAQVLAAETRRPLPSQPEAGQFVMLGLVSPKAGEFGMESNRQAKAQYERALALDPNSVPALLGYVRTRLNEVLNSWAPKDAWSVLLDEAERAIAHAAGLEPRNAAVHVVRGQYLRTRTKDAEAVAALAHALTLYSRFPAAHAELGRAKIEVGLAKEAVGHIEEAILLSPADPSLFTWYLWAGMAETDLQRYESSIEWLLKSRQGVAPSILRFSIWQLRMADPAIGNRGRTYLEEYRAKWPNFSITTLSKVFFPGRSPIVAEQRARIVALLCKLGAPGCAATTSSER